MNSSNQATPTIDRIRRAPWVCEITSQSRTTIWRREKEGNFPKRVKLGPHSIGWRESEILDWIASRQAA